MGEVYRARDARLGRDVAVKVLSPRLDGDRDAVARFEQEARSASALSHPNILQIYDIGTADIGSQPIRYIVMELVDGETLSKKIAAKDATLGQLLAWMGQVADGLAKAHDHGIVHRDLKPDNIMISRDGYAKILDFGLAKLAATVVQPDDVTIEGYHLRTSPGLILGTAPYMAPEQAQGRSSDARSDIFAFGCILFEAVTRRRAFSGSSLIDTLHRVIHTEPDYQGVEQRLASIIRRCLVKDPDARYATIRDASRALRSDERTPGEAAPRPVMPSPRIALLPFDDLSPARDNEYFAEGLAEEINSDLSKIHSLCVLSRASVRNYQKDIPRLATELGATYLIDGSVRKAGNQLRITAQLIDAATQQQLWSEKYTGTLDDIFDIQESVSRSVASRLQIELTSDESQLLARRPMSNIDAYDCYLRARRSLARFDEEGLAEARKEIERGIAIAGPNIALLSLEGYTYFQYYNLGIRPDTAYLNRAHAIARQIFEAEPDSIHGHRLLGIVAAQRQQMRDALHHLQRVLEIEPNEIDALMWIAFLGPMVGKDVREVVERLSEADPYTATTYMARAWHRVTEGDFESVTGDLDRAAELGGGLFAFIRLQLFAAHGRVEELRQSLPSLHEHRQDDPFFAPLSIALACAVTGDALKAEEILTPELLRAARLDYQYTSWVAEIFAQLGRIDEAFEWLESSISRGYAPWKFFSQNDRLLDPLRNDSRFDVLMERARVQWESFR